MFGGLGFNEFLMLMGIIAVLSALGIWPRIVQGLRELRGEPVEPTDSGRRPGPTQDDLDICFRMLGLSPSATLEQVERAYRQKAKIHHPDRGGDNDTMRALNEAYTRIKQARTAPRR